MGSDELAKLALLGQTMQERDEARRRVQELEEALKFYANDKVDAATEHNARKRDAWERRVAIDGGSRARNSLDGGFIDQSTRREMGVDAPDFGPTLGTPESKDRG